jgi:hypothetical protein
MKCYTVSFIGRSDHGGMTWTKEIPGSTPGRDSETFCKLPHPLHLLNLGFKSELHSKFSIHCHYNISH